MLKSGEYLVAAALMVIHTVVITLPERGARLAASNVVTNLIRVEALEKAAPPYVALAGSSMTGRIPEQVVTESAGMPVVNLGLDGCGPADSIKHLLERDHLPVMVIIEGNAINSIGEENSRTVREQFKGVGGWLHATVPFMRYRERPVDVVYSWLRYRSLPSGESAEEVPAVPAAVPPPLTAPELTSKLQGDMETLESVARTLQQRGVRLFVLMLPDNQRDRSEQYLAAQWLMAKLAIPMIDLKAPHETSLTYSDAVHLDLTSARRIARTIGQSIRNEPPPPNQ